MLTRPMMMTTKQLGVFGLHVAGAEGDHR